MNFRKKKMSMKMTSAKCWTILSRSQYVWSAPHPCSWLCLVGPWQVLLLSAWIINWLVENCHILTGINLHIYSDYEKMNPHKQLQTPLNMFYFLGLSISIVYMRFGHGYVTTSHRFLCGMITHPWPSISASLPVPIKVLICMINYTPYFCMDVITYVCPKFYAT